jgi:diguanylate cyclase (GGDEF)-like protein
MAGARTAVLGRRASRTAVIGLAVALLSVTGYVLVTSWVTAAEARIADASSRLSDDYEGASAAVQSEESLERKYRLEPGPGVRLRYDSAAAELVAALGRVRAHGDAEDIRTVDAVLAQHTGYLEAIGRMFVAVDRGDTATVLRIDSTEVDPRFGLIQTMVDKGAADHRTESLAGVERLRQHAARAIVLTPVVLLSGFLLVLGFASVLRRFRRQLQHAASRAVHDSLHDALTGLPNRMLLADRVGQALRGDRRAATCTGLLVIDIDRFKDINDTLGHHYGDQLLVQMGSRLAAALREVDTVARLGGDEFAVLLPAVGDVDNALRVAAKLRHALESPFHVEGGIELDIEASVGVVVSGQHGGDSAETLLQRADIAMYVAKQQNLGVFAYRPDVDGNSLARLSLLGDLRRGLDRGELILHYQPKISLSTGEIVGVEALVRWNHPTRGLVRPDEFMPLAERTGLIGPLTRYVLDLALAQVRTWSDAGRPLPVAVNLSARNLLDDQLADQVLGLLDKHGVPAAMLELEVTETAIMTQPLRAQRLLQRLRDRGVRLSVDDFGSGYTSLAQLTTLPVTEIKVDRSFVQTMTTDPGNALIVHSVIELAHNLGLAAVAEGVENEEALTQLAGFGCDIVQGYHLSRPLPVDEFDLWYASGSPLLAAAFTAGALPAAVLPVRAPPATARPATARPATAPPATAPPAEALPAKA